MAVLPTPAAERALVDRCMKGDRAAHSALFTAYSRPLAHALSHLFLSNPKHAQIAEELTELVFVRLVENQYARLGRFNPKRGSLVALLVRIALDERSVEQRSRWARLGESTSLSRPLPMSGAQRQAWSRIFKKWVAAHRKDT
jgi:DNA-directed RNA polymerase specialized sigma24 family protein